MNTIQHDSLLASIPLRILSASINNDYLLQTIKTHDHPFYQLEIITAGQTMIEFDGRQRVVSNGMASFSRPYQAHGEIARRPPGRASNIHIKFEANIAWSPFLNLAPIQRFYHVKALRNVVRLWNGNATLDKVNSHLKLALLFLNIAHDQRYRKLTLAKDMPVPWLEHTVQFIHEHLASRLTVAELARQAHKNASYFSRCFNRKAGMSPVLYIQRARIERAKTMLSQGATCKETAFTLSFPSVAYFSRVFKHVCGIAPSRWIETINIDA